MSELFWQLPPWLERRGDGTPVAVTRKQRLGLKPIAADAWFVPDPEQLAHKRAQLAARYAEVVAVASDLELPELARWRLPVPPSESSPWHPFVAHFAGVAEDVCLLDAQRRFALVAACLCAPSYWNVHEKIGKPLWDVHGPVEGLNARIGQRIERFLTEMPLATPFCRRNWFVHGDAGLYHPAPEPAAALSGAAADWFFRSERQVLYKPAPEFVLFTLHISHAPVSELAVQNEARAALLAALEGMDEDEIAHFGGVAKYARLHDYVARL